ncbi:MAG: NAD-dependent epimerase/dehydratase family protein [Nocardioidaceae bacterium]
MTVLIAGCGDLGTEIGVRFASTGRRVYGIRRSPLKLPAAITGIGADLGREVPTVPPETEIVVMATAADGRTERAYRTAYLDALQNLLDGLGRGQIRPRRFLFVSSTSVYGSSDGWIDEDTPTAPTAATAAILRDAETLLHRRMAQATVLRLTGLYGPGRTRLIDQVRDGSAVIADPDRWTNRIHRDDAAAAIVHLTTIDTVPEPIYIGVDDQPATRGTVLRFLADELDSTPPVPAEGNEPPSGRRCRNDRLTATGFQFRYPTYRDGYRAILAGDGVRHP